MFDLKNEVLGRIISLYSIYEEYVLKHDNTKINILIQDESISFYLYNDRESIDEFIITFSLKENKLYRYISINMLLLMISEMLVYRDYNEFYNDGIKPYLRLIVNDEKILKIMSELVDRQYLEIVNDRTDIVLKVSKSVPDSWFYPYKFMNSLEKRIGISKTLLRMGDNK